MALTAHVVDELSRQIYNQNVNVGWWDDPNRCIYTTLQLISTEIAEATEGERKNLMDDHLPKRAMGEVELADAAIRAMDLAGRFGWEFLEKVPPHPWCQEKENTVGHHHLGLNACVMDLAEGWAYDNVPRKMSIWYSTLMASLEIVARHHHYHLLDAIIEKHQYNATRADHKRENREKENGKKF